MIWQANSAGADGELWAASARERPVRLLAGAGIATMAWLGLYGFAWSDYETEARAGVRGARARPPARVPAPRARLRRLARRARAVRAATRAVGRRRTGGLPDGRVALPAGRRGARGVARRRCAPPDGSTLCARGGARSVRRQPTHAESARSRPSRGVARRRPVRSGGAARRARAAAVGGLAARPGDRKQGVGAARGGAGAVRAAVAPTMCCSAGGTLRGRVRARAAGAGRIGGFAARPRAAAPSSSIFQPWQIWWFLGHHGAARASACSGCVKPGYRTAPGWVARSAIHWSSLVTLPLGAAVAARRTGRARPERDALLLLALLLLLRCMLDTWDTVYYVLPFVLRCSSGRAARAPAPAGARAISTALAGSTSNGCPTTSRPDTQAAFFLAWTLPLAAGLAPAPVSRPTARPAARAHALIGRERAPLRR